MSILFVSAGRDAMRRMFAQRRRAAWCEALPLMLEKHGLPVTVVGSDALGDQEVFHRHTVVIVAPQPPEVWTTELAVRAGAAPGGVIVEGPIAPAVAAQLGVRAGEPTAAVEGAFQVVDASVRNRALIYGPSVGGALGRGTTRPIELDPRQAWKTLGAPIEPAAAAAWRAVGWDCQTWVLEGPAAEVIADWIPQGDAARRQPAIARAGGLVGFAEGLLSFLGQSHTVEPFDPGEQRNWPRTDGLEALLLGLIDLLHARAGRTRARVLPWPRGRTWALNVRHDVDRWLAVRDLRQVLDRHDAIGTRATWYWRSRHLAGGRWPRRGEGQRAVAEAACHGGHEVALHTELLWQPTAERATIEAATGLPIHGSSAHGDPNCFRFQGAPNILWAEREGFAYTELISHGHAHPHRCALLQNDGTIVPSRVLCLPHHASFERSMKAGDTAPTDIDEAAERMRMLGGLLQVLNHPDVNVAALFDTLASLPSEERWDVTAVDAADWWASTHVMGALEFEALDDGRFCIRPRAAVEGMQIELLAPDGTRRTETVSAEPGRARIVGP